MLFGAARPSARDASLPAVPALIAAGITALFLLGGFPAARSGTASAAMSGRR